MSDREDMVRMQEEAIRRVREMQARARQSVVQSNQEMHDAPPSPSHGWKSDTAVQEAAPTGFPPPAPIVPEAKAAPPPEPPPPKPPSLTGPGVFSAMQGIWDGIRGFIRRLGIDEDRILILLIIILLSNEEDNELMLMALFYLLL